MPGLHPCFVFTVTHVKCGVLKKELTRRCPPVYAWPTSQGGSLKGVEIVAQIRLSCRPTEDGRTDMVRAGYDHLRTTMSTHETNERVGSADVPTSFSSVWSVRCEIAESKRQRTRHSLIPYRAWSAFASPNVRVRTWGNIRIGVCRGGLTRTSSRSTDLPVASSINHGTPA